MAEIDWKIESTEYDAGTGAVATVHWRCLASEGETVTSAYGSVSFEADPEAPEFVPLEELTEQTVLGWVWAQVDQEAQEALALASLESALNPPVVVGLPWAQEA